jgi:hypothetical protein
VPPNAPEYQDDRRPKVTLQCLGTRPRSPPLRDPSTSHGQPVESVPEVESPRPNLTGYHTTKEQVLKHFRLLVAERTCHGPRHSTAF